MTELLPFKNEGELEKCPLAVLIAQISYHKRTGMLHIESSAASYWIYFEQGFPAGVHNPQAQIFLGSILRELNCIDSEALNNSLAIIATTSKLQGQVLLGLGAIDEKKLEQGLSLLLVRKVSRLFCLRSGSYRFVEHESLPSPHKAIRVNPLALIYNSIRNTYRAEDLQCGLQPLADRAIRTTKLFRESRQLFAFSADDLADTRLLQEYRAFDDFVRHARTGSTAAMMILLTLYFCNMLEIVDPKFAEGIAQADKDDGQKKPPQTAGVQPGRAQVAERSHKTKTSESQRASNSAVVSQARQRKGEVVGSNVDRAFRAKVLRKYERTKDAKPWETLEVDQNAELAQIKQAFFSLAKSYHPDRLASVNDPQLKKKIDVVFGKINDAYQLMSDPSALRDYLERGAPGSGQNTKARVEEGKIQYQKALVHYRKSNYVKSSDSLRWATEMDPSNPDYQAWRIWVDYLRSEVPDEKRTAGAKGKLLPLAKEYPNSFWVARFLSQIFQKIGDVSNYERFLNKAYHLNPKDVDCARELRLLTIRREKKAKESKKGKFFGFRLKK